MFIETQAPRRKRKGEGVTRKYSMRIRSLIPTGDTLQIVCTSAPTSRSPRRASAPSPPSAVADRDRGPPDRGCLNLSLSLGHACEMRPSTLSKL